jgi:26S proteasome regulatory subunit N6
LAFPFLPKSINAAKAALTASRTAANSIYVTPLLQAELDEMSGVLYCEEKENITGFSYFLEVWRVMD